MLTEIGIVNFQSHRETVFQLADGVNTLIGDSDSGKSSVFRALMWLFTNRPVGDSFRSWWGGDTEVWVLLKDGQKVGRIKGKGRNVYYIDDIEYEAVGNGPPPEQVARLLNLESVNFLSQMASPFLISESSGKVGRFLNDIAGLDVIDRAISNAASQLKKERAAFEQAKQDIRGLESDLKGYAWIDAADSGVADLEAVDSEIDTLSGDIYWLEEQIGKIEEIEERIVSGSAVLPAKAEVERLVKLDASIGGMIYEVDALALLVERIELTEQEIEEKSAVLPAKAEVESLIALSDEVTAEEKEIKKLEYLLSLIERNAEEIEVAEWRLAEMESRFHELMPDICPLCGRGN